MSNLHKKERIEYYLDIWYAALFWSTIIAFVILVIFTNLLGAILIVTPNAVAAYDKQRGEYDFFHILVLMFATLFNFGTWCVAYNVLHEIFGI